MVESPRMNLMQLTPDAYRLMFELERTIAGRIEPTLLHLIKLRASQINGCAYCLAMHTAEALRDGESAERLMLLDAWKEAASFSAEERAALAWVEEITLISDSGASRATFDGLKAHFSEEEIGWLTLAATQINSWNRVVIASRSQYRRVDKPAHAAETA